MSKPSRSIMKAFAVGSTLGAVLKSHQNGDPKLLALQLQINRMMKVFHAKAGPKTYWHVANAVAEVWEVIAKRHQNEIKEHEVPRFTEYLCMLIPPKDFKTFLAVSPYRTSVQIRPEVNAKIVESILLLDEELNKLLGTKPYTLTKPKATKIKVKKQRDKSSKVKTQSSTSKSKLKEAERKSNVRSFLRDKIKAAKEQ